MAQDGGNVVPRIERAEHIGPDDTGDNIEAKRVANYVWDGNNWKRDAESWQLERLLNLLKPLSIVTGSGSNRLSVDVNSAVISSGTITTVTTVTTVTTTGTLTNQTNIGGVNAFVSQQATLRNAYANGISNNLAFS